MNRLLTTNRLLSPRHDDEHRVTSGDVAAAVEVLEVDHERELALCSGGGRDVSTIDTALVAPVAPREMLLVHAGTAIGRPTRWGA